MSSSFFWFLSQKSQPYSNQLHTGSFLCTCTVPSPPLSCLLLCGLTSQYGVTQRSERLELEKNLRGRARGRWEKPCNTSVGTAPLYRPFYTRCFSIHTPRILCKPLQRMPSAWKILSRLFKSSKNKQKDACYSTSPNTDHNSDSIFTYTYSSKSHLLSVQLLTEGFKIQVKC